MIRKMGMKARRVTMRASMVGLRMRAVPDREERMSEH